MAGEPSPRASDIAPTKQEVDNGHWPAVSNYFEGHGNSFPPPHTHRYNGVGKLLRDNELERIHKDKPQGQMHPEHGISAVYA